MHMQGNFDSTLVCELDGVADQIGQHLLQAPAIHQYISGRIELQLHLQVQALLPRQTMEYPLRCFQDLSRTIALWLQRQLARFDLGQVENVANQQHQSVRG
ncbi:hypothetical protein D3C75_1054000 [compost metagenome]